MKKNFQDIFFNEDDELNMNYISNERANKLDEVNFYSNVTNTTQFMNTKKTFTDKIEKYSSTDGLNYTSSQQMKLLDIQTEENLNDDQNKDEKETNYLVYEQHIAQQGLLPPSQYASHNRNPSQKYDSKINTSYNSNNQVNSSINSSNNGYDQRKLKEKYSHFFENEELESNQRNLSPQDLQKSSNYTSNRNKRIASCDVYSSKKTQQEQDQQYLYQEQRSQPLENKQLQSSQNQNEVSKKAEISQSQPLTTPQISQIDQQKMIQQNKDELNHLKEQFLQKVDEIQNNLKSIDPYKISLNSIHSNTTNFNQTYMKRQEELNSNLLKINQLFDRQTFLDSAGTKEIQNQLQNMNLIYPIQSNQREPQHNEIQQKPRLPHRHPAGESSIVKNRANQSDLFDNSLQNHTGVNTVDKGQGQQLLMESGGNLKQKELKDRSLLDILKKKENIYEKVRRDYNLQKEEMTHANNNKNIQNILQGPKETYKNYSRDSLDRQKIQFYDSFMPQNLRMMKSPYQLLKYKMNNKAKFDVQSCISELASINSSLKTTYYK